MAGKNKMNKTRYFVSNASSLYTLYYIEESFSFTSYGSMGNAFIVDVPAKNHYVKNLSKDYERAISKAKDYVAKKDGVLSNVCEEKDLEEYSTETTGKKYKLICESNLWIENNKEIVSAYKLCKESMKTSIEIRNLYRDNCKNNFDDWAIIKDDEYLDNSVVEKFINAQAVLQAFNFENWGTFMEMVGSTVNGQGNPTDSQYNFICSLFENYKNNYEIRKIKLNAIRKEHLDHISTIVEVPVTEDRIVLQGEITSTKLQENDFGHQWKMVLNSDEGYRLYGSIPKQILDQIEEDDLVGTKITFSAIVTKSDKDKYFGFFKRPTKAEVS
jgi:hypothetical protein|tara:strand:- start:250 stop:1233 length:984 start_codon:yes stop_codon:yes gene_type:complete